MAYDRNTHTITVGKESEILVDLGASYIDELRIDSHRDNAPSSLVIDWKIIEEWLDCFGRELNSQDNEKISKAWRAYFAIGRAPSEKLQPLFMYYSNQYKKDGRTYSSDKPPAEVMHVFDHLLATDDEIKKKRESDWSSEKRNLESILNKVAARKSASWWRSQSKVFRMWAFVLSYG